MAAARALADAGPLAGIRFARIVSSPSLRALGTARAIAPEVAPETDPRLRERSFGDWEGRAKAELAAQAPEAFTEAGAFRLDFCPPGGEPAPALLERVHAALAALAAEPVDGPTLLVSHNGTLRAAFVLLGLWDFAGAAAGGVEHLAPRAADLAALRDPASVL